MADLRILAVTSSFHAEWKGLAESCGLSLEIVNEPALLEPRSATITLIAAAGDERSLLSTLARVPSGSRMLAADVAEADHRLVAAVVRAGVEEVFLLPADFDALASWLRGNVERLDGARAAATFAAEERARYRFDGILGQSHTLLAALERAARVIPRPTVTVLITGETGTGKELLARAIHYNGPRREAPFVDVNCAAIPDNLLESELFGHEKGAFTGAASAKPGLMELANGGTLFLDEIGHLPLALQGKILRALEERTVRRVGGVRSIPFDVRLVAATHVNLADAVRRGEFREDLYYRLNVVPVNLPALRTRGDDVVLIAQHFLARFAEQYALTPLTLDANAARALRERGWPGNVRELRNVLERAVLLSDGPALLASDLAESEHSVAAGAHLPFPATIAELTRAAVLRMLELCDDNKSEAARRLGISRPRLQRLMDASADDGDEADTETS